MNVAAKAARAITAMYLDLCTQASTDGELERFFSIGVPAYRLLQLSMSAGISINVAGLSEKRSQVEHEYFLLLKNYLSKHDMPLKTPSKRALEAKLLLEGFELDEVSVEYLLEFVPHYRDFGVDTMALLALDTARRVLGSLTLNSKGARPVVDVFGSRTSRVQSRGPSLQNIPKWYWSIINAHDGAHLSYVDFDQFEVDIMAALSGDEELNGEKDDPGIRDLCEVYDVEEICFDPNRTVDIMNDLAGDKLPVFKFDQSRDMLVPALDTLREVILEGRMQHGGHPILRWNFENISMTPPNRNGNRLFEKERSRDRIDGASACLMAIHRAAMGEIGGSFYSGPNADNPAFWSFWLRLK